MFDHTSLRTNAHDAAFAQPAWRTNTHTHTHTAPPPYRLRLVLNEAQVIDGMAAIKALQQQGESSFILDKGCPGSGAGGRDWSLPMRWFVKGLQSTLPSLPGRRGGGGDPGAGPLRGSGQDPGLGGPDPPPALCRIRKVHGDAGRRGGARPLPAAGVLSGWWTAVTSTEGMERVFGSVGGGMMNVSKPAASPPTSPVPAPGALDEPGQLSCSHGVDLWAGHPVGLPFLC